MGKRILHILRTMNRGGAETCVMNMYRGINREEYQFDFLLNVPDTDYTAEITNLGGRIYIMPTRRELGFAGYRRRLDQFFREHAGEYEAVHLHCSSLSTLAPLAAAKQAGVPIRITHGHSITEEGIIHKILHFTHKLPLPLFVNRFLACSELSADWLYGYSPVRKKAVVVKNGIDIPAFEYDPAVRESVRKTLGIGPELVFGHVGRFCEVKNHKFLLNIFANYTQKDTTCRLLLVGQGPLMDEVRMQAEELGLTDRVHFLGIRSDIHELLQAMDIMIFPSLYEGLPVSLVEAQTAGLKLYCSDRITTEVAIIDGVRFYPLECGAEEWADRIRSDYPGFVRASGAEQVRRAGYDSRDLTALLETNIYRRSE